MKLVKPKYMAQKLGIQPSKLTILAKDIENANLYKFPKTPLGSFLFYEKNEEMLKEYQQTLWFFKRKKEALLVLERRMDLFEEEEDNKPDWDKFLGNVVYVK
jgi:hypothetical protein